MWFVQPSVTPKCPLLFAISPEFLQTYYTVRLCEQLCSIVKFCCVQPQVKPVTQPCNSSGLQGCKGMEANARRPMPPITVHARICRLLACIWAFLVVVDIAIYVSPGAGRHCPRVDGAENLSSAQLRDAFSAVLVAHIVHIWLCGIAWISMEEIAKWPDGNEEKAELQGRSVTELKRGYILVVYFLLGIAAFISAWITKSNGYSSLSNISAVDCLHGTFRLAWFYSLLWFANIVYLGGVGVLCVCGVIGAGYCGHALLQESVDICKACRTQQTNSQDEFREKLSSVIPEAFVADVSDAA